MGKLKSSSGCRTCLVRKKKCDEVSPQCGNCTRLGIVCVKRTDLVKGQPAAVTPTNLKGKVPGLALPITNGYRPFASDLEKSFSLGSSRVLSAFVSCTAGPGFEDMELLVNFCAQDGLVRQAIAAFAAFTQAPSAVDGHKEALKNYQGCITQLKRTRLDSQADATQTCFMLTAVCFLGLLESIGFGDPGNALMHFAICKNLLVKMLAKSEISLDSRMTKVLRAIAESIMFNTATLSPYSAKGGTLMLDWGSSFDRLFPIGESASSPFLGGLQSIYRVMLRANMLIHRTKRAGSNLEARTSDAREYLELWGQLDELEREIPHLYDGRDLSAESVALYKGKHKLAILALRVQLCKIARPLASPTDGDIEKYVSDAVAILEHLDIREPGNPALRWPLTTLACATHRDRDFVLLTAKMQDLQDVIDPANAEKLSSSRAVISRYPSTVSGLHPVTETDRKSSGNLTQRIDLLLQPLKLLSLDPASH